MLYYVFRLHIHTHQQQQQLKHMTLFIYAVDNANMSDTTSYRKARNS